MNEEIQPCKKCGSIPRIVKIDDLFYAQCTGRINIKKRDPKTGEERVYNVACNKWAPHEHLGLNKRAAISAWNLANTRNGVRYEHNF